MTLGENEETFVISGKMRNDDEKSRLFEKVSVNRIEGKVEIPRGGICGEKGETG